MKISSKPFLYLILLIIIGVDCYADDLLGLLGIPPDIMFGLTGWGLMIYIAIWFILISLLALVIIKLQMSFEMSGWIRILSYILIFFSIFVMLGNHTIRLYFALNDSIVDQMTVPEVFFIETYLVRMSVYAVIFLVSLVMIANIGRPKVTFVARSGSYLLSLAILASSLGFFLGGATTLADSPYWDGNSILHGRIYMGTVPRHYTNSFEPIITFMLLFALGLVGAEMLRKDVNGSILPIILLFSCILIQVLPRLGTGLLSEAFYSSDFYYAFRLDRSLSFPLIPWLILSLGWASMRLLRRNSR